jgi:hypothetical protein
MSAKDLGNAHFAFSPARLSIGEVQRGDREWIVGNSYVRVVRYPGKGEPLRDTSARQRRHPYGWRPVVFIEL